MTEEIRTPTSRFTACRANYYTTATITVRHPGVEPRFLAYQASALTIVLAAERSLACVSGP